MTKIWLTLISKAIILFFCGEFWIFWPRNSATILIYLKRGIIFICFSFNQQLQIGSCKATDSPRSSANYTIRLTILYFLHAAVSQAMSLAAVSAWYITRSITSTLKLRQTASKVLHKEKKIVMLGSNCLVCVTMKVGRYTYVYHGPKYKVSYSGTLIITACQTSPICPVLTSDGCCAWSYAFNGTNIK